MKRLAVALLALVVVVPVLPADVQDVLKKVDRLYNQESHEESRALLEASQAQAAGGKEKAEIYWRLARTWLKLGDQAEDRGVKGDALLAFFAKGEELAQLGIDADPQNHLAYFWKSATAGRWGQVKGILNALSKAKPMRDLLHKALGIKPDHADSYYVLGQLFEQVPGGPVSFGDKDWAVSLGRKAVDQREAQFKAGEEEELAYDYYTELAKHLWERNWNAAKRQREQARKASQFAARTDPLEKNAFYEGTLTLKNLSDREEALALIQWTVRELESIAGRTANQNDDLQEAREVAAGWKK